MVRLDRPIGYRNRHRFEFNSYGFKHGAVVVVSETHIRLRKPGNHISMVEFIMEVAINTVP